MGKNLADGGFTPRSVASRAPAPAPVHRPAAGNPTTRNRVDGGYTPPSRAYQAAATKVPSRGGAPSAYSPSAIQSAASAAIAGGLGAAQGAVAAPAYVPPPPPPQVFSGSGRSRGFVGGAGTGTEASAPPAVYTPPAAVQAPTAAVMPPPEVNPAGPGAGNVAGESFDKVGAGSGTFGQEQRRRQARGPMTGLSVTPEMLRRAATQRIG